MAGPTVASLVLAFAIGTGATWTTLAYSSLVLDNSPAVTVHKQVVLTPVINGDGVLKVETTYTKRPYCDVLRGSFELQGVTHKDARIHIENFRPRTYGTWQPGDNKQALTTVVIPSDIPAGTYQTRWSYTYKCAGTFREQTITSPWLSFVRRDVSRLGFATGELQ